MASFGYAASQCWIRRRKPLGRRSEVVTYYLELTRICLADAVECKCSLAAVCCHMRVVAEDQTHPPHGLSDRACEDAGLFFAPCSQLLNEHEGPAKTNQRPITPHRQGSRALYFITSSCSLASRPFVTSGSRGPSHIMLFNSARHRITAAAQPSSLGI